MKKKIDKSQWGDGPWQNEPDYKQWKSKHGFKCEINRSSGTGNLCGYIFIPIGHPWHKFHRDDYRYSEIPINCHGGLTYGRKEPFKWFLSLSEILAKRFGKKIYPLLRKCDRFLTPFYFDYKIGFDCAHLYDLSPGMNAFRRQSGMDHFIDPQDIYRSWNYVEHQVETMAKQAYEAANNC